MYTCIQFKSIVSAAWLEHTLTFTSTSAGPQYGTTAIHITHIHVHTSLYIPSLYRLLACSIHNIIIIFLTYSYISIYVYRYHVVYGRKRFYLIEPTLVRTNIYVYVRVICHYYMYTAYTILNYPLMYNCISRLIWPYMRNGHRPPLKRIPG